MPNFTITTKSGTSHTVNTSGSSTPEQVLDNLTTVDVDGVIFLKFTSGGKQIIVAKDQVASVSQA